jgi:exopolysaccharide production protein ExoQ
MSRWYYWASGFFLLQITGALEVVDRLVYGEWAGKSGDKITEGLNLLMIGTALTLFVRGVRRKRSIGSGGILARGPQGLHRLPRTRRNVGSGGILALAVVAFLFLSALWSIDDVTTIRRSMIYLFVIIGAIGVADNLEDDEFMNLLGITYLVSAFASVILLAASPGRALMPDGSGDLRGIFSHKNVLAQVMAAGVLASLHGIRVGGRRRRRNIYMLILFVGIALAAKSATSLLTIFGFCLADAIISLFRRGGVGRFIGVILILVLVPFVIFVTVNPDSLFEIMGKNPTLTGRTDLWPYVINDIYSRPMLGWGYSAFWSPGNPAAQEISNKMGYFVPEAHNGLLEMLLEVGIVGTSAFVVLVIRNVTLAFRSMYTDVSNIAISLLLCSMGILLVGVSEEVLVDPFQASVSIFFITGLLCERTVRAKRYPVYMSRQRLRGRELRANLNHIANATRGR